MNTYQVSTIRKDFPFLSCSPNVIYFDNAATTHKPHQVIETVSQFYACHNAPIARGIYRAAEQATARYEEARTTIARYIVAHAHEVIFTSGATEGINMVAACWAQHMLKPGDELLVTQLEHNANFVVWQQLAKKIGARLVVANITAQGELDMQDLYHKLSHKTRLVAITQTSNVLGTKVDVGSVIAHAHAIGARVLVDATQAIPHQRINVHELGADFLVFSGHKMLGPTGSGVLYVAQRMYEQMHPCRYGGGMVQQVTQDTAEWAPVPHKFEAGSPLTAQALGLAQAVRYLEQLDFQALAAHEAHLTNQLIDQLTKYNRVHILGPIDQLRTHGHMVSFVIDGIHAHDIAAFLDAQHPSIAVSAGKQCANIVYNALGIQAAVRVSFYVYSTSEEIMLMSQYIEQIIRSS